VLRHGARNEQRVIDAYSQHQQQCHQVQYGQWRASGDKRAGGQRDRQQHRQHQADGLRDASQSMRKHAKYQQRAKS
jgi:hypothetical protein